MTHQEALQIPDLDIEVTDIIEDCFYVKMAVNGNVSEKAGQDASQRLKGMYCDAKQLTSALNTADRMIDNLRKYGVACAAWCEK